MKLKHRPSQLHCLKKTENLLAQGTSEQNQKKDWRQKQEFLCSRGFHILEANRIVALAKHKHNKCRADLSKKIKDNADMIFEKYERKLVTSEEVHKVLSDLGYVRQGTKSNAVGKALGASGLKLPSVVIRRKKIYDISQFDLSERQRCCAEDFLRDNLDVLKVAFS